jgi:hypothetical protein
MLPGCENGNGRNGRHRSKSQLEPTLSVQGALQICHPLFRLPRRGMAPDYLSLATRLARMIEGTPNQPNAVKGAKGYEIQR